MASEHQRSDAEARDRAQMILGAVSLVLWFAIAFGLAITWYVDDNTPQPIFMAGGIALMVAAVPWLAYKLLVRRLLAPTAHQPPTTDHSSTTRRGIQ